MDKFSLAMALFICALLIVSGVCVWFSKEIVLGGKVILSFLLVSSGLGLGAVGVDLWRNW